MAHQASQPSSAREILKKFYEAERIYTSATAEERDYSVIAVLIGDEFYMEQSSALPWAGVYRGPQGLRQWIEKASEWVTIDVRDSQIFENAQMPSRVVVLSQIYYRCVKTGREIDFPLSQTIDFDLERGVMTGIRSYYWDVKRLNDAMGYKVDVNGKEL